MVHREKDYGFALYSDIVVEVLEERKAKHAEKESETEEAA
jgi:hypothetical protein